MQDMRVVKSDREFFVQLLAEYGLTRGGVKAAVGEFLKEKGWHDSREVRVKLLARMRVCNPNYKGCKPEWRAYYAECREQLRSETTARHLTRALARDRHLAQVMARAIEQLQKAKPREAGILLRGIAELVRTELEVEKHERNFVGTGVSSTDAGDARQVESAGSGGLVRELISALDTLNEG